MDKFILDHVEAEEIAERLGFLPIEFLGQGAEGEVYKAIERHTQTLCAIKFFFPSHNKAFKRSGRIARKLHKLRHCPIIPDYLSHRTLYVGGENVACLATDFIEGERLEDFVKAQRGKRLGIFPALHLLYSLVVGVESIHHNGEYHGDLHVENIIIKRFGLNFDLSIIDLHHWGDSKQANREEDIIKCIRIFYDILGGAKRYASLSPSIKYLIAGQKRSLILERFKSISDLRWHLESMDWSDAV